MNRNLDKLQFRRELDVYNFLDFDGILNRYLNVLDNFLFNNNLPDLDCGLLGDLLDNVDWHLHYLSLGGCVIVAVVVLTARTLFVVVGRKFFESL